MNQTKKTETEIHTVTEISAETDTECFRSLLLMIQLNVFCTLFIKTRVTKYQCYRDTIGNNFIEDFLMNIKTKVGEKKLFIYQ